VSVFSVAIDQIFNDPSMATDATYTPDGGSPVAIRLIRKSPDALEGFGAGSIWVATNLFDVRVSEVAAPAAGDQIVVDGDLFEVQGEPRRDRERLVWTIQAVEVTA
jgi:hypothetical protein